MCLFWSHCTKTYWCFLGVLYRPVAVNAAFRITFKGTEVSILTEKIKLTKTKAAMRDLRMC
jgi:hypothetical protein